MNNTKRTEIFSRLRAANPQPKTELVFRSPFELLIAVILSAQATDKSVNLATAKLFAVASTPREILSLGEQGLFPYIQRIGLFRNKAKNIVATCRMLIEQHDGEVPRTREELEQLPGVGRKTANVVLNVAFGESTIAVDTFFALPTGPDWHRARTSSRSRRNSCGSRLKSSGRTRTTG